MAWFGSSNAAATSDADKQKLAPRPHGTDPLAPVPLTLPPDTAALAAQATAAGLAAAKKQKKKAAGGGIDTLLTKPAAGVTAAGLPPTSLLGS